MNTARKGSQRSRACPCRSGVDSITEGGRFLLQHRAGARPEQPEQERAQTLPFTGEQGAGRCRELHHSCAPRGLLQVSTEVSPSEKASRPPKGDGLPPAALRAVIGDLFHVKSAHRMGASVSISQANGEGGSETASDFSKVTQPARVRSGPRLLPQGYVFGELGHFLGLFATGTIQREQRKETQLAGGTC